MLDLLVFFISGLSAKKKAVAQEKKKDEIFLRSAVGTTVLMCIANFLRLCFFL